MDGPEPIGERVARVETKMGIFEDRLGKIEDLLFQTSQVLNTTVNRGEAWQKEHVVIHANITESLEISRSSIQTVNDQVTAVKKAYDETSTQVQAIEAAKRNPILLVVTK